MKINIFLLIVFFLAFSNISKGIGNSNVVRGERPPIDFENLKDDSYQKGVLLIRFTKTFGDELYRIPVIPDSDGIARFRLESVDRLNEQYGVRSAVNYFNTLDSRYAHRHEAWGFHLWYRLELREEVDMPALIRAYEALDEIEIAEPEFRKILIGSNKPDGYYLKDREIPSEEKSWIPNDPQFANQWHYHNTGQQGGTSGADISLSDAWQLEKGSTSVIVAVIDGGIDYTHQDLAGNMWPQLGYNFVAGSSVIVPHNHGTHVAGTISAVTNNNTGVAGIAGGSGSGNGARLMSCQVFTSSNSGGFHLAPIYAADNGAAISQNSWSYTSPNVYEQSTLDAIDYFNLNGGGSVMDGGITIFAAGNSDSQAAYYPGYYSGTLAVAATNNQDVKSWYSNYGSWIDISAPGGETNVVTQRGVLSTLNGNTYGYYQGTSMACPHVSGVAALILSLVPGELEPQDIKDILLATADNHYASNPGYTGQLGTGRLNAFAALTLASGYLVGPGNPSAFQAVPVSESQINLSWELNDTSDEVMLAWSSDGNFGTPQQGVVYFPGEVLPGGGSILYKGNDLFFSHSGLDAVTQYNYKIWSVDPDHQYSTGRTANASTLCGAVSLPHSEGFNQTTLPECWSFPQGQGNWSFGNLYPPPSSQSGTPHASFSWSPTLTNYSFSLTSLVFDATSSSGTVKTDFLLFLDNYDSNYLEQMSVEYKIVGEPEWQLLQNYTNTGLGGGNMEHVVEGLVIPGAAGQLFQIRFRVHGQNSYSINGWSLDDVNVYQEIPVCNEPSDLFADLVEATGARLNWQPGGDESLWNVKWGYSGFDPLTEGSLIENIEEPVLILDMLSPATEYDFYARAVCTPQDQSNWSGPASFTTLQQNYTLTFTILNTNDDPVSDAVITLNGMTYPAGEYVFPLLSPGVYNYMVSKHCYLTTSGQVEISDADLVYPLLLENKTGDANGDGFVNVSDIVLITNYYMDDIPDTFCFHNADTNQDGVINVQDIIEAVNIYMGGKE